MASFSTTDDALVLASVSSPAERELLNDWLQQQRREHPEAKVAVLELPDGDPPPGVLARLVEELEADEDRTVVPVRVFWVPGGLPTRSKVVALISGRDTYRPPEILQRRILKRDPSRARVVAGEPAKVSELRQQWSDTTAGENPRDLAHFVIRRASLAIERVELRLLGPEYKSPQLVKPEMLASARFREGLEKIPGATLEKAGEMIDELGTGWSRFSVDLIPSMGRAIFSRGFDPNIDYDRAEIENMRHALETHPAVLLFSHRSYLDGAIVPVAMQENRLPPVHTFAGINLSFGFMGPLMRRSGVIFIRRKLDDPLYKYVLRQFIGYIVEKRFNLSWSIEGTRSRTGKMLPPKLGLMSYVADAYLEGRSGDILLQPVSISFDQLHETAEYAAYARGGEKTPEGVSWLYNFIKAQGERNYGKIYVRFPEAVSMREYLGEPGGPIADDEAAKRLAMQKMAIEVSWRILRATPVNATGLVVGAAADDPRHRADPGPTAPHAARLAGLPGAQADSGHQQRVAAAHRRRCSGRAGRAVQRPSGHVRRRRTRAGLADRAGAGARGGVLPQYDHRRVPRDRDRRARAGLRRACRRRSVGGVLDSGDAAARPVEVRLLLRGLDGVP